jgi:ArsR family transcriptional regulator
MDSAKIERISKALADETRLLIFEAIAGNKEISCGKIATLRRVTPATVSHHVKILSDAGLIECRRHGQFVHNRVVPQTIEVYARALCRLSRAQKQIGRS